MKWLLFFQILALMFIGSALTLATINAARSNKK